MADSVPSPLAALAARAQSGDRKAFELLVHHTARLVYAHIVATVRDRQKAEDLTQDTFVSAWKGMLKPVALAGIAFAAVAGFMHWVVAGPNEVQPEDELEAKRLLENEGQRDANDVPPETDKPV